jgi:response regulator NasT
MDRRPHILLVEDDRLVLATLTRGLDDEGFEVSAAQTAAEAVGLLAKRSPDLALLDVRLPDGSGIDLAKHLKDRAGVPFLFLSAYGDLDVVQRAVDLGALGYLVKPVDVAQLVPELRAALARAGEITALREVEDQLRTALEQGREASIAVGILMERFHLDREGAFELLRDRARSERRKLAGLAHEILQAAEVLSFAAARGAPDKH